jgi:hypothetical protein
VFVVSYSSTGVGGIDRPARLWSSSRFAGSVNATLVRRIAGALMELNDAIFSPLYYKYYEYTYLSIYLSTYREVVRHSTGLQMLGMSLMQTHKTQPPIASHQFNWIIQWKKVRTGNSQLEVKGAEQPLHDA